MGDILLEKNQTVETVISDALKRSFAELGYEVLRNQEEIYVKSDGKYQIASGRNWMEIMHKSIQKYMEQVKIIFSERKQIEIDKITKQISKR